jgi:Amt family ammonium transporter
MVSNVTSVLPVDPPTANASTAFLILAAMMVFIMTPAVGVFYSGLARQKHSLTLVMLSFCSMAIVTVQWYLFGFSLAYSENGSSFLA